MSGFESDYYLNTNYIDNPFFNEICSFKFSHEEEENEEEEYNKILNNNNYVKSQEKICVEKNNGLNYFNKEKNSNFLRNKTAKSSLCTADKFSTKKEKLIFNISKITRRGRKCNNQLYITKAKHTKKNKDNIINKCKIRLINISFLYINSLISKSDEIPKIKLKKINTSNVKKYNKQSNIDFFKMTLKELFSKEISKKYKIKNGDKYFSNENIIKEILEKGNEEIKKVLNKTLYDILLIYVGDHDGDDILKKLIEDNKKKFRGKYKNEQYITLYEQKVNDFKNVLSDIYEKKYE